MLMQIIEKTEYQDLYRVTDGVLLVINKFVPIAYKFDGYFTVRGNAKQRRYNKRCQKWLQVLEENYYDKYDDITVPKVTVLYMNRPVVSTDNQPDWTYEVKTTGNALSGDFYMIEKLISSILYTIRTGEIR